MDEVLLRSLIEENKLLRAEVQRLLQSAEGNLLQSAEGNLDQTLDPKCREWKSVEFDEESVFEIPEAVRVLEDSLQLVLEETAFGLSYRDIRNSSTYTKVYNEQAEDSIVKDMIKKQDVESFPEVINLIELRDEVFRCGAARKRNFRVEMSEKTRSFSVVCEPVRRRGELQGVITILLDKSSQEIIKDELRQMRAETKQWERTEQNLRQTIKSADEAMEAKNTFLAVMSHEIRTPLNGVLGMAQVLATTCLDPEQKELVDAMMFSGDVLLAIISDILDFSKIKAGTMKLEEREFNPRNLVEHVARTATAAIKDRGIKIEVDISDDVPAAMIGDPLRLKQVITNLVFNAVKFTKEGHVRIQLKVLKCLQHGENDRSADHTSKTRLFTLARRKQVVFRDDAAAVAVESDDQNQDLYLRANSLEAIPEDFCSCEQECRTIQEQVLHDRDRRALDNSVLLEFAVEDTGIGIPEDAFPSLFEKFTQVHSSTTRNYGGTGLGLAICKQLVELMGGHIFVSSRVGEGSTFSFTLRCNESKQTANPNPNLEKTTSTYATTAHFHKLQAGLSCTRTRTRSTRASSSTSAQGGHVPGHVASNPCPISVSDSGPATIRQGSCRNYDCDSSCCRSGKAKPTSSEVVEVVLRQTKQLEPARAGRLRRTSSGPPRIECSLMADVEDSTKDGMILSATSSRGRQPRLLLAEDNKVNVLVAMSMLKRLGLTADVAFNGQEAISAIQTTSYDLVFMDVCMPVLDGLEVTRRVRLYEKTGSWEADDNANPLTEQQQFQQQQQSRRLPIVAITANALSGFEEQCVQYGMDSFVTKPITFRKLQNVLHLFLTRSHQSSA